MKSHRLKITIPLRSIQQKVEENGQSDGKAVPGFPG